jgi:hypothetical protein
MVEVEVWYRIGCPHCEKVIPLIKRLCSYVGCTVVLKNIDFYGSVPLPDRVVGLDGEVEVSDDLRRSVPVIVVKAYTPITTHKMMVLGGVRSKEEAFKLIQNLAVVIERLREIEKRYFSI